MEKVNTFTHESDTYRFNASLMILFINGGPLKKERVKAKAAFT